LVYSSKFKLNLLSDRTKKLGNSPFSCTPAQSRLQTGMLGFTLETVTVFSLASRAMAWAHPFLCPTSPVARFSWGLPRSSWGLLRFRGKHRHCNSGQNGFVGLLCWFNIAVKCRNLLGFTLTAVFALATPKSPIDWGVRWQLRLYLYYITLHLFNNTYIAKSFVFFSVLL
jgi:hypothetical protein